MDRGSMLPSVEAAKKGATDGLVKVVAFEVRTIQLEIFDNDKPTGKNHVLDAVHRPIEPGNPDNDPPNPAHSQVEAVPVLNGSRFVKLKERLAQIATRHGWIVAPTPPIP